MIDKMSSLADNIKSIGGLIAVIIGGVVSITIFWIKVGSLEARMDQNDLDYVRDKKEQLKYSNDKFNNGMKIAELIEGKLHEMHIVIHDLEISSAVKDSRLSQIESEVDNIWVNYNEELRRQIK